MYTYTPDGHIHTVTETGPDGWSALTTYTYDDASQLTGEERVGDVPLHFTYTYDLGGNRLSKTDHLNDVEWTHFYDVHDPMYQTRNNRLMMIEVTSGGMLEETIYFEYDSSWTAGRQGNPTLLVRKREDETVYKGTTLQYTESGLLWFLVEQEWDENDPFCENPTRTKITEVRGGPRQYLVRERDPDADYLTLPGAEWFDFDSDYVSGRYEVDADGNVSETGSYLLGIGQVEDGVPVYFHSDHSGSLRAVSYGGQAVANTVITAWGETMYLDTALGTRYQYNGSSGYEALYNQFRRAGYRLLWPELGRWMQADPIGRFGGLNGYTYVDNQPLIWTDPTGLVSSLMRPEGFVALIEAETAGGSCIAVTWGGRVYQVMRVITTTVGNKATTTFVTTEGAFTIEYVLGGKAGYNVTQTSCGIVVEGKASGVCGATGLEALPAFLLLLWQRRRQKKQRRVQP